MAYILEQISTYVVTMHGGPDGNDGVISSIFLGIPNAYAYLNFYPDGAALPANRKAVHANGKAFYYVSYHVAQLGDAVDLLRNEAPVKFLYREDTNAAYITTGAEPVGEGEA